MALHIPCCLCGRTLKGVRPWLLHLVNQHKLMRIVRDEHDHSSSAIECACGRVFEWPTADWNPNKGRYSICDHLYAKGGLQAHLWQLFLEGPAEDCFAPPRTDRPEPLS